MRRSLVVAIAVVSAALVMSACSSSKSGGGGTSSAAAPATSAAPAASGSGSSSGTPLDQAKAYLAQYLSTPTSINVSTPLSKKPDAGKLVVGLDSGLGSAKVLAQYWQKAAADLGWTYKDVNSGSTSEDQQKAMDTAIQLKPAGILTSGIPIATIQTQLTLAQQKGIWVNTSASTDSPAGAMFDTSIANPDQLHEWGKMIAAYVVANSNGSAHIQLFDLPVFPILLEFDKAFKAAITQWCPACKMTEHPQQGSDIGTNTPGAVVSAVQKDPSTNWLIFDLGDLETGVDAALSAAGLHGMHIAGLTADTPNIAGVKNKTQDAWTAYSLPIVAYRQLDSLARKFNGDPLLTAELPTQIITQDNVSSLVNDSAGNYVGVADYQAQFKKLWLED
jgi:ribose transport system substrate-binding protein